MNKLVVISNIFPSSKYPTRGTFVKDSYDLLKKHFETELIVLELKKNKILKIFSYVAFFRAIIKHNHYGNVLYCHYANHPLLPFRLIPLKCNLIVNAHGGDLLPQNRFNKLLSLITLPVLNKASCIVVPSLFLKERLKLMIHDFRDNNIIIYPSGGVNTKLFTPKGKQYFPTISIGFVGRIISGKGWKILLEAFKLLHNENVKLLIIGDGPEREQLETSIKGIRNQDRIEVIGGVLRFDLTKYYQNMDVFVFPTLFEESLGLVALEALSCGVPVIAPSIGAISEYLIDKRNGYLFKKGDSYDLYTKLLRFIKMSVEEREIMSKEARESVLKYEAELVSKQFISSLKNFISN